MLCLALSSALLAAPNPAESPPPPRARVRASLDEGFGVETRDGRFAATFGFLLTTRYRVQITDQTTPGFQVPHARSSIGGHLWGGKVDTLLLLEFAAPGPRLLDAWATWWMHPAFGVQFGQFRPHYTRGFGPTIFELALPDRGTTLSAFRLDRDLGAALIGRPFGGRLELIATVMNGEGVGLTTPSDPHPLVIARLTVSPLGPVYLDEAPSLRSAEPLPFRIAFGVNGYTNRVTVVAEVGDEPLEQREIGAGADVGLQWRGLAASGEFFWRQRVTDLSTTRVMGSYGLVSYSPLHHRLQLAARVGGLKLEADEHLRMPIEGGVTVFLVRNFAKLQAGYKCVVDPSHPGCELHEATVQAQLRF